MNPEDIQQQDDSMLEALLENQDANAKSNDQLLEAILENQDSNAKSLEPLVEAQLVKADELIQAIKSIPLPEKIELPEQKEVDLSKTNTLLKELLDESKKKEEYAYDIEIDPALKEQLRGPKGDTTIVEKVIEKTEVIRETPIVTNEVIEVAKYEDAGQIRDKLSSLKGEKRLDISAIKGITKLKKEIKDAENNLLWVNNGAVKSITAGTGISITGDAQNPTITNTQPAPDLSGYVPYTGATTDVDLGTHTLKTPTLYGGSSSGGNLTLQSTSHATKGKILFGTSAYDEVNNRLGIGTTSPSSPLEVTGAGNANVLRVNYNDSVTTLTDIVAMAGFRNDNTTNNTASIFSFQTKDLAGSIAGVARFGSINTSHTTGAVSGDFFIDTNNAGSLTEKFRITASGTVGIGTTNPSGKLHLRGTGATKATTALYVDNSTPAQILKLNNDGSMAIGLNTTLTGANSLAFGLYSQATGDNAVALGYNQRATATGAMCISANAGSGYSEASGPWSVIVGGLLQKAQGRYSTLIGGIYGSTTMYNQITFGHDRLVSGTGSFQTSIVPLSANITGTAQTELFIPSLASGQAILPVLSIETNPAYTMWNATITVNAFTRSVGNGTGTLDNVFGGEYRCIVRRAFGSTTVTMVGSGVQTIYEDADTSMADAVVTIDGDSSTGALRVRFTPPTTAGSTTVTSVGCTINYLQTFRS